MASSKQYKIAFALNSRLASGFNKSFSSATKSIQNLAKTAKAAMATTIGAIGAKNTVGIALTEAMNLEGFKMQLETATKSAQKAGEIMKWSIDLANRTPFETGSVVEASARLEAMGLSAQKYLPMIGDMAGATNKDLIQATEAIIDAQTGELERLKEFGIKKDDIVAYAYEKMNKTQVVNNKGQITNQQKFNEAMLALMDDKFKGGMEKQASTMKGIISTISGVMKSGMATMVGITADGTIKQGSLMDTLKSKAKTVADTFVKWQQDGTFEKIGDLLSKSISQALKKFEQLKSWATDTYDTIKAKVLENKPLLDKIAHVVEDIKVKFSNLKGGASTLDWLKDTALPKVADGVMFVLDKSIDLYDFISTNWETLKPIIIGIGAAFATLQVGKFIFDLSNGFKKCFDNIIKFKDNFMKLKGVFSGALSFFTSPIGATILAIGALVVAGILLYKNWDKIKAVAIELWNTIKTTFGNIGDWIKTKWNETLQFTQQVWTNITDFLGSFPIGQALLQNITNMIESIKTIFSGITTFISGVFTGNWAQAWEGVKSIFSGIVDGFVSIFKAPINGIIGLVNQAIRGINAVSLTIPDWVPEWAGGGKTLGFSIPEIPMFAKGTMSTPKGAFIAGEKGPELISGAPGRRVFTNAQTKGILSKSSNNESPAFVYSPNVTVNGDGISESKLAQILEVERRKFWAEVKAMMKGKDRLAYG